MCTTREHARRQKLQSCWYDARSRYERKQEEVGKTNENSRNQESNQLNQARTTHPTLKLQSLPNKEEKHVSPDETDDERWKPHESS